MESIEFVSPSVKDDPFADRVDPFGEEPPSDRDILAVQPRTTDAANADAVAASCGARYRYVVEWSAWLQWTGTHWAREGAESALFADAILVARREYYHSKERLRVLGDEYEAALKKHGIGSNEVGAVKDRIAVEQALLTWHKQSQNTGKAEACVRQLRHPLAVRLDELNRDAWLFNCVNGTVDLRTAELRDHDRDDLITRCSPIAFDLRNRAPTWERFLTECMGGNALLVLYLQRLIGYTLTASVAEHMLVFCYGLGKNGKSTFFGILHALLGPYAISAPRSLLFERTNGEVHPTEIATLYGKRLAVCAEVGEEALLDEAKVKDLTGGDIVSCRRMHEDFWDLAPTHKLWLGGNHKPLIRGTDDGIWRRMRVVPWTVQFAPEQQDKELPAKLARELPGILAWAVHGCLEWQRIDIADPPEVTEATAEYRVGSDIFGEFLRLYCQIHPDGRTPCKSLRTLYERWCEEVGHLPLGARRIGARLSSVGVRPINLRVEGKFVNGWAGLRILADWERAGEGHGPLS